MKLLSGFFFKSYPYSTVEEMALLTVWVYVKVSSAGLLDFMVASSPVCCIPRMAQNNQESFMEQL